jgi:hypothetical protein
MKKQLVLFVLAFLCLLPAFSQMPKITWGPEIAEDNFIGHIFLENEKGIYSLAIKKEQFFLQLFDSKTLALKKSTEIVLPKIKGLDAEFEHVHAVGGNIVVFSSALDKASDQFHLVAYPVSPELVLGKTATEVFSIPVENKRRAGDFGFALSQDSSMIMVYNTRIDKKTKTQTSSMKVLHPGLGTVAEVTETFPLKSDEYIVDVRGFMMDVAGNIGMVVTKTDYKGSSILDRQFELYYYDNGNGMAKTVTKLDAEDARVATLMLKPMSDGTIVATGFYSEKVGGAWSFDGIAGTVYMKVNPQKGEIVKRTFNKFDVAFQAELLGSRRAEKGKLIPNFYRPRHIEALSDNSVVMTAEFLTVTQYNSNGMLTTVFQYNDVIVAKFGPDGKMQWAKHLIKEQVFSKREVAVGAVATAGLGPGIASFGVNFWINLTKDQTIYYSYLLGRKGDDLCFVYNDNPENVNLTDPKGTKTLTNGKKGVPVMVTISPDGKMTKQLMVTSDDEEVVFRPAISLRKSGSRIIVYGSRKGIDKMGSLSF